MIEKVNSTLDLWAQSTDLTPIIQAKNLKICVTAGVGSDHVDLNAAAEKGIQVLEVTGSNVVSVAEHVVMSILLLVRNFVPAHEVQYKTPVCNITPSDTQSRR